MRVLRFTNRPIVYRYRSWQNMYQIYMLLKVASLRGGLSLKMRSWAVENLHETFISPFICSVTAVNGSKTTATFTMMCLHYFVSLLVWISLMPFLSFQVKKICNCTVLDFPFDKFPGHVQRLKAYCWKPLIIKVILQGIYTTLVIYLFPVMIHWWVRKPSRGPNNCMFRAMTESEGEVGIP